MKNFVSKFFLIVYIFSFQTLSASWDLSNWNVLWGLPENIPDQFNDPYIMIPLGSDCETAIQIRRIGARKVAFPLDWLVSRDCDGICKLLENKFNNFLKFECLQNLGGDGERFVLHKDYNIVFVHDFYASKPLDENVLHDIRERFDRRIVRFMAACSSGKHIYFFRKLSTYSQAKKLRDIISNQWPRLNFTLVVLDSTDEIKEDWKIPNVRNFFIKSSPEIINGWSPDSDWDHVFTSLHVKLPKIEGEKDVIKEKMKPLHELFTRLDAFDQKNKNKNM